MDTPTYNQYCLQSLDASNTFQHSEAWFGFQENEARNDAIKDFGDISKPKENLIVGKYLFYRGIKAKKLSGRASTNPAKLVGLFAPVKDDNDMPSITSEYLCFVYKYKPKNSKKNIMRYVCKMINKISSSFYIDNDKENENQFLYKNDPYKQINETNNLIELQNVSNIIKKTIVQVKIDPLLCLQSALYVEKISDIYKGYIFLNCLKYWHLFHTGYGNNREIILNILNRCLVKYNEEYKYIQIFDNDIITNTVNYLNEQKIKRKNDILNLIRYIIYNYSLNPVINQDSFENDVDKFEYTYANKNNYISKYENDGNQYLEVDIDNLKII